MDRIEIINKTIKKLKFKNYLEIGVYKGDCFLRVKCRNKKAVDPKFQIGKKKKLSTLISNPSNFGNKYFELLSDVFFSQYGPTLAMNPIDMCFIDGLHTFEQSTKDVLNTLKVLRSGGYIMLHDCCPPNKASAAELRSFEDGSVANIEGWTGEWCGDVWKTIVTMKKLFPKFEIGVFDCDYGIGVIKKTHEISYNFADIQPLFNEVLQISYENLNSNRKEMLNLINPERFNEIIY
jgi:hypothetical protein